MSNHLFARSDRAIEEARRLCENTLRIRALAQQTTLASCAIREEVEAYRQEVVTDWLARRRLQALAPMPDTIIRPRAREALRGA
ncbi:hypothetical protein [Methylobacterium nodulans]|nr:hypothetical protein [Methylobacterium nodulans]